jgi:uncharacterized phage-like protein YoqJ
MAVADACVDSEVPFIAAVPFPGQERGWPAAEQDRYHSLLPLASSVQCIGRLPLTHLYHRRDRWIVDHCDKLWSLCDGRAGGTFKTTLYAIQRGRRIEDLWTDWQRFRLEGVPV